jgi:hypothetical protein
VEQAERAEQTEQAEQAGRALQLTEAGGCGPGAGGHSGSGSSRSGSGTSGGTGGATVRPLPPAAPPPALVRESATESGTTAPCHPVAARCCAEANTALWFANGADYFAAVCRELRGAKRQVFLAGWW